MPFSGFLAFAVQFVAISSQAGPPQSEEVLLRQAFAEEDSIFKEELAIPDTIRNLIERSGYGPFRDTVVTCYTAFTQRSVAGYGLAGSVRSKSSIVSVLMCLDTTGSIVCLELPEAPDPWSSRLQSTRWRKQFDGETRNTLEHIDALSGATISSDDVTGTVKALLLIFQQILQ